MHLLDLPDEVLGCILGFTLDSLDVSLRSRQRYRLLLLSLVCKTFAREAEKLDRDKLVISIGETHNEAPVFTDTHRSQVKTLHVDVNLANKRWTSSSWELPVPGDVRWEEGYSAKAIRREHDQRVRTAELAETLSSFASVTTLEITTPPNDEDGMAIWVLLEEFSDDFLASLQELIVLTGSPPPFCGPTKCFSKCKALERLVLQCSPDESTDGFKAQSLPVAAFPLKRLHQEVFGDHGRMLTYLLSGSAPGSCDLSAEDAKLPLKQPIPRDMLDPDWADTASASLYNLDVFFFHNDASWYDKMIPCQNLRTLSVAIYDFTRLSGEEAGEAALTRLFPALTHVRLGRIWTKNAERPMENAIKEISSWRAGLVVQIVREAAWAGHWVKKLETACAASKVDLEWLTPSNVRRMRHKRAHNPEQRYAWSDYHVKRGAFDWDNMAQRKAWLKAVES